MASQEELIEQILGDQKIVEKNQKIIEENQKIIEKNQKIIDEKQIIIEEKDRIIESCKKKTKELEKAIHVALTTKDDEGMTRVAKANMEYAKLALLRKKMWAIRPSSRPQFSEDER